MGAARRTRCRIRLQILDSQFRSQEGTQFWYGDSKKFLTNKGKGAKYFEIEGCVLKNYDSLGFTVVPRKGPVRKRETVATYKCHMIR